MNTSIDATISSTVAEICVRKFDPKLRGIILTGSLARGEATFKKLDGQWITLGDAEFFLIFNDKAALPSSTEIDSPLSEIATALSRENISCPVSLSPTRSSYFRNLKPHIFAYELRVHGKVVWGDDKVLCLIPAFSRTDIPLEDGWRLLCNRMIEFMEAVAAPKDSAAYEARCDYKATKLYLDMATSYLLFTGDYEPSYHARAERLRASAAQAQGNGPFDLQPFSQYVSHCTSMKLGSTTAPGGAALLSGPSFWQWAATHALQLCRWELQMLTGQNQLSLGLSPLMHRWMAAQPVAEKIRGWLYVLRKQGWHRSWRNWANWTCSAWQASPRYQVYATAGELFANLPSFVKSDDHYEPTIDLTKLRRRLPITLEDRESRTKDGANKGAEGRNGATGWRQLASDIVWNYHEFLEGTRA